MWLAVKKDLIMERGSTFDPVMTCLFGETEESAQPADISGWTFYMQMRAGAGDPVIANFDMLVPDPTTGKVYIILDEPQTRNIEPGFYKYDIEGRRTNPLVGRPEIVRRFAYGKITVQENITEGVPI